MGSGFGEGLDVGCGLGCWWVDCSGIMHSGLMVSGWLGVRIRGGGVGDLWLMPVRCPSVVANRDHPRPVSEGGKDGVLRSMLQVELSTMGSVSGGKERFTDGIRVVESATTGDVDIPLSTLGDVDDMLDQALSLTINRQIGCSILL